jgi:hypothetical protein
MNISMKIRIFTTGCLWVKGNFGIPTTVRVTRVSDKEKSFVVLTPVVLFQTLCSVPLVLKRATTGKSGNPY